MSGLGDPSSSADRTLPHVYARRLFLVIFESIITTGVSVCSLGDTIPTRFSRGVVCVCAVSARIL